MLRALTHMLLHVHQLLYRALTHMLLHLHQLLYLEPEPRASRVLKLAANVWRQTALMGGRPASLVGRRAARGPWALRRCAGQASSRGVEAGARAMRSDFKVVRALRTSTIFSFVSMVNCCSPVLSTIESGPESRCVGQETPRSRNTESAS